MRRFGGMLTAAMMITLVASAITLVLPVPDAQAVSRRASVIVGKLAVAEENPAGYERESFPHWIDADGDGCDTRREVLISESRSRVSIGPGCRIIGGRWMSVYDGVVTRDSSTFDIDHLVALAEAWRSGARRWNVDTRTRFANDLGFAASLIAVTASANRSKSDRDPASWLPPILDYRCEYVVSWIQVKYRWRLSIDTDERQALRDEIASCGNPRIEIPPRARIGRD